MPETVARNTIDPRVSPSFPKIIHHYSSVHAVTVGRPGIIEDDSLSESSDFEGDRRHGYRKYWTQIMVAGTDNQYFPLLLLPTCICIISGVVNADFAPSESSLIGSSFFRKQYFLKIPNYSKSS